LPAPGADGVDPILKWDVNTEEYKLRLQAKHTGP
jgi:hypothetical protein